MVIFQSYVFLPRYRVISRNDFRAFKITVALTCLEILNFVANVKPKQFVESGI